jgi:hypothetical protein
LKVRLQNQPNTFSARHIHCVGEQGPSVTTTLSILRALGVFDPVVLAIVMAITVIGLATLFYAPAKKPVVRAPKTSQIPRSARASNTATKALAATTPKSEPGTKPDIVTHLDRLSHIIQAGTAQSLRVTAAHASAAVKINAAEHSLGRMLQEMQALTLGRSDIARSHAVVILPGISDQRLNTDKIAA